MSEAVAAIEVNPAERLPRWVQRFADIGSDPADDPGTRLRKRMLLLVVLFATLTITVAIAGTLAVGDVRSLVTPAIYLVVSVVGIGVLLATRRIGVLLYSQLTAILVLPAMQQWMLGGFAASAGSVLYTLNAALLAVVLVGPRRARWWLLAFASVVVLSGLVDPWLTRNVRPADVPVTLFYVVTVIAVGMIAWLPLAFFVESRRRLVAELDRANAELDAERRRSDALLLNILPPGIASRLKDGERPIADRYDEVAVLFADIEGFTPSVQGVDPEDLIHTLNQVFTRFDRLAAASGMEKVKTIGDAYMAVSGAPEPHADAVTRAARMALQMQGACEGLALAGRPLRIRVGLDVGPVVGGVIGEAKFAWDLYGDVVNTAARMESHGVAGRVQVTERFARRVGPPFGAVERGAMEVKGKGTLRTYFLLPPPGDQGIRA